jgi:hypothetical protein
MEFHFIKLNVNGTHLSLVDPSSKSRFVCFPDVNNANKCIDYVASFRSRHGVWPSFDMSEEKRKIKSATDVKSRTPEEIRRYLEIETYDLNVLDRMASRSNVSFYCVLAFDTVNMGDTESISMTGREFDGEAVMDKYIDWMNINLKVN